MFSSNKK